MAKNTILNDLWDDEEIDITKEANFIWSIANKLRGVYTDDEYGNVIIPMTIIRRFECTLRETKDKVIALYEKNPNYPSQKFEQVAGYKFFNTSKFDLKELCNDQDNIAENFKSYIDNFSDNVKTILKDLDIYTHIEKMNKGGCLYTVVKAFSEIDLSPILFDSIKMGYIFENLIGRFYQNVTAGQFYTGRDIIKLMVSILTAEGCDDLSDDHKVITICDQACGTGGMLTTAYSFLKKMNETLDIRLFGQEFNPKSYAVGLAEMLIKGQDGRNYRNTDTFKEDCFKDIKMRFVLENPPFGTPWAGEHAKEGQKEAVEKEYAKRLEEGQTCRWPAGLPSSSDAQLIFMQSAISKLDPNNGRAAIIQNGSPLFSGGTSSGESQIRKWLLENDFLEAIIALPTDLFYNTGIQTYIWIISMNKRKERKGKVQLIDASEICHKLRKSLGHKRNEINKEDRKIITQLYNEFKNNEKVKIFNNKDFIYREYTVMQPLQRSYAINDERIENLINNGILSSLYDEAKVFELQSQGKLKDKDQKKLDQMLKNKPLFDKIIETLKNHKTEKIYLKENDFYKFVSPVFDFIDSKLLDKIIKGLSLMDKNAEIHKDKKGKIIYDKASKDIELVNIQEDINDYMKREVLPHVPDAKAFFEEDLVKAKQKTGAEIPFTRYFYKYVEPEKSDNILKEINSLNDEIENKIKDLF